MAETCINCGSELFYGQRFCRSCGSSTREEAPTQRMTPPHDVRGSDVRGPDVWGARGAANTAPTPKQGTNPVYAPPSFYQPTVPPLPMQPMPPYTPPRSRSWVPILVLIILLLFGGGIFVVRSIVRNIRSQIRDNVTDTRQQSATDRQTFALNKGATVSIITLNGAITVDAWDQPQAEIKIIKRGKAGTDIQNVPVNIKNDKDNLSIDATQVRGDIQVSFEIHLPRNLGAVRFASTNGSIHVSDVAGNIIIEATNGAIKLDNVSGIERAITVNGSIEADLNSAPKDHPVKFETTNGKIDLNFNPNFNATLEASTLHGSIDIDDEIGISVQKSRPSGQRASGPIGKGGQPLTVTTVNGSINISR